MTRLRTSSARLLSACSMIVAGLLVCFLAACEKTLAITPLPVPAENTPIIFPSPTDLPTSPPITDTPIPQAVPEYPTATMFPVTPFVDDACWFEWTQTRSVSAYECASKEYSRALESFLNIPEYHFRLGVLNWEMGESDLVREQGREEILNAIELDVLNEAYVEYLFANIIPPPAQENVEGGMAFYTDQFTGPTLIAKNGDVAKFTVTEVHSPKNVAEGSAALRLEWEKPGMSWASLIVGFDHEIENRQKALGGALVSWGGLNPSNLGDYAITFWVKGEGLQGGQIGGSTDATLHIKLQDQNIAIRPSIGNQMVFGVEIKDKWEKHTVSLKQFEFDPWFRQAVCPSPPMDYLACQKAGLFHFDWSRVKQINFDVPFYSTSGVVFLDEIRIVKIR